MEQPKKNLTWLWIILIIVVLGAGGYFAWKYLVKDNTTKQTKTSTTKTNEAWTVIPNIAFEERTSTDTHKLIDGKYRMYYMGKGGILYADSTDLKTFSAGVETGVKEEMGKMISNPAVIQTSADEWIMIYEMAPMRQPGQQNTPPGVSSQRNLYLAKSKDGMKFVNVGIAVNSAAEDNYFASVPDLIKTPDGKIRLYYVCQADSICSRLASDDFKTWTKEKGFRLTDQAVDPDVLYKDGKWVMYYSVLDPAKNAMYKATSSDGLVWSNQTKLFAATTGGAIVDPDVFEISPQKYMMFLGQSTGGGSTGGETINLYQAELNQSIF